MLLLKRLRTRLSIPLGLRHDEGTHLKRSDWWRQKVLVPVQRVSLISSGSFFVLVLHPSAWLWPVCPLSASFLSSLAVNFSFHPSGIHSFNPQQTHIPKPSKPFQTTITDRRVHVPRGHFLRKKGQDIRFLTIGTCFFARTICITHKNQSSTFLNTASHPSIRWNSPCRL